MSSNNRNGRDGGYQRGRQRCYRCDEEGHFARDCTTNLSGLGSGGGYGTEGHQPGAMGASSRGGRLAQLQSDMHREREVPRSQGSHLRQNAVAPPHYGNGTSRSTERDLVGGEQRRGRSRSPDRGPRREARRPRSNNIMGGMTASQATRQTTQSAQTGQSGQADRRYGARRETTKALQYPGKSNEFADPYMLSTKTAEGRDVLLREEFRKAPQGSYEEATEQQLTHVIQSLASRDLKPAEIPGHIVRAMNSTQLNQLTKNLAILSSHPSAALFVERYGELDRAANVRTNIGVRMGAFGLAPITENLFDLDVGVHDTDRFSSVHGPGIGDRRHVVLLNRTGAKLQVASVTGFGGADGNGSGRPPLGQEDEYGFLLEEMDTTTRIPPGVSLVVGYSGVALTKPLSSYVRLSKPFDLPTWAPITWAGYLSINGHKQLADAFRYDETHKLRAEGERKRQELALQVEEMGNNKQTLQERQERQERERREGEERMVREQAEKVARAQKAYAEDEVRLAHADENARSPQKSPHQEESARRDRQEEQVGREKNRAGEGAIDNDGPPTPPGSSPDQKP